MLTIKEVIKTLYNALLQRLKKHRGNWEQNVPSADDYIKNRPFYVNGTTERLLVKDYTGNGDTPKCNFIVGQAYNVIWNGKLYEDVICINEYGRNQLGDDDYPFYIDDDGGNSLYISGDPGTYSVSISIKEENIVKLDKKYLPDGLDTDIDDLWENSNSLWYALDQIPTDTVRYGTTQSLTTTQKTQARANIGAIGYEMQILTDSQKDQARINIGLAKVASSENFSDLWNKPFYEAPIYSSWSTLTCINSPIAATPSGKEFERWKVDATTKLGTYKRAWKLSKGPTVYIQADYTAGRKFSDSRLYFWGNAFIYSTSYTNTGENWCIYVDPNSADGISMQVGCYVVNANLSNATLETAYIESTVTTLNEESVPDTIARISDLATVATTGSYNDLKDKPTISQSDWEIFDETSQAYIVNRPFYENSSKTFLCEYLPHDNTIATAVLDSDEYWSRKGDGYGKINWPEKLYCGGLDRYFTKKYHAATVNTSFAVMVFGNPKILRDLYYGTDQTWLETLFGGELQASTDWDVDTGENYCIAYSEQGYTAPFMCTAIGVDALARMKNFYSYVYDLKELDEKFIPDTIARVDNIITESEIDAICGNDNVETW